MIKYTEDVRKNRKRFCFYKYLNKDTGHIYFGSGILGQRAWKHKCTLQNNKHHNRKFQEIYNQNPNFDFSYTLTETREEAYLLEKEAIDQYWGNSLLLNLSNNVRAGTYVCTPEIKNKMRLAKLGTHRSEETKLKIGLGALGNKNTLGRKLTPEHIAKVVSKTTGLKRSPESLMRLKIGSIGRNLGFKHSEETRKKMSNGRKGIPLPPPTIDGLQRIKDNTVRQSKPVSIDGITYASKKEASRKLSVGTRLITKWLLNSKHNSFYLRENDMATQFQQAPRKKIALDNSKLNLNAPCPTAPGKTSAWTWGFVKNNPRITVYTRDPADNTDKTGYGKIVANLDSPTLYMFFNLIEQAIKEPNGWKDKVVNRNYTWFGGKRSDAPVVLNELWAGKDADGCIWVSIVAKDKDRPIIKFIFGGTEFHHLYHGDGTQYTAAEASIGYAKGYVDVLRGIYTHLHVTEYVEPEPPQQRPGGNNYGGGGQGGGNSYGGGQGQGGGGYQRQAPSIPENDLPF